MEYNTTGYTLIHVASRAINISFRFGAYIVQATIKDMFHPLAMAVTKFIDVSSSTKQGNFFNCAN